MAETQPQTQLIETRLAGEKVYSGHLLQVHRDTVGLSDGSTAVREYIAHPGAAMVIPLLYDASGAIRVVLERQFRYPVARVMLEFPAGKLDSGESPWVCAQRELREETGYVATEWAHAGALHPVIAYSTECIDVWFARGLQAGERSLDAGEFLEVFDASPDELLEWCYQGAVTDAKTLTGMLWLQNVLQGKWTLDWKSVAS